jgi:hypothetical protein
MDKDSNKWVQFQRPNHWVTLHVFTVIFVLGTIDRYLASLAVFDLFN